MSTLHPRPPLLHPAPLEWLLEPTDPPARARALVQLLDLPESAPEVKEARTAIATTGRMKAVLETQRADGTWGDLAKGDAEGGTAWNVSWLLRMGLPARDPRLVAAMRALLAARQVREVEGNANLPAGAWSTSKDPADVASCVSGDGLAASLAILGPIEENRAGVMWLLRAQRHDGGWLHCHRWSLKVKVLAFAKRGKLEWPEETDPSVRSCRFGTYRAMRALATLPEELRDDHVRRALSRGADHLLARGLTGSLDNPDADVPPAVRSFNAGFQLIGTPVRQTTDMLAMARLLVDLGYGADPRLARTLERIRQAQGEGGRWRCETNSTGMLDATDSPAGKPSKQVTIDALTVLRRVARSHGYELDLGVHR